MGKRILCTDNESWSDQDIILASRAQHHVERAFKQMKNPHWGELLAGLSLDRPEAARTRVLLCAGTAAEFAAATQGAHGGHLLTIEQLLAELSAVTEVVNLYAAPEPATRGRYRAQYVLSERSSLQDKLCRLLDVHQHAHP